MPNFRYSDVRSDSPESPIRVTCLVCGKPLEGQQRFYCSAFCKEKSRASRSIAAHLKAQEAHEAFEEKARTIRITQKMCDTCVWKRGDACVMPSCFRGKGIGYERGDSLFAEVGKESGLDSVPAAETPGNAVAPR